MRYQVQWFSIVFLAPSTRPAAIEDASDRYYVCWTHIATMSVIKGLFGDKIWVEAREGPHDVNQIWQRLSLFTHEPFLATRGITCCLV